MIRSRFCWIVRVLTLLVLAAFLSTCTKQVPREPLETRHYQVEWEKLDPQRIEAGGLWVEAVPLTPSQWPLEASVKSLLSGDFIGVIDRFDLRFYSSKLEEDVLEDLYEEGYVAVYVRVSNSGVEPRRFLPTYAALSVDGTTLLWPVLPDALPEAFRKVDWAKTGLTVVVTALVVVLIAMAIAAGRDSGGGDVGGAVARITGETAARTPQIMVEAQRESAQDEFTGRTPDQKGLLTQAELRPGESIEGFLFFLIDQPVRDWTTATVRWVGP